MKPIPIVLTINFACFAIFGLLFTLVADRPEMIPMATSLQALLNVLAMGIFYLSRDKKIVVAFGVGAAVATVITVVGYFFLIKYGDQIGFEERYTTMLEVFELKAANFL
ncbi:MAG: hypothetical protein AAF570_04650 [Bacteroidota bacterium]